MTINDANGGSAATSRYLDNRLRRAVVRRCGGCCEDCGRKCKLTMHHRHYDTVGNEALDDIVALCWPCHQARHRDLNGDYWRDEEEMQTYWWMFWKEMDRQ